MWVSDFLCITGWLSIAFAKEVVLLNFGRIISGIGFGLTSYVVINLLLLLFNIIFVSLFSDL